MQRFWVKPPVQSETPRTNDSALTHTPSMDTKNYGSSESMGSKRGCYRPILTYARPSPGPHGQVEVTEVKCQVMVEKHLLSHEIAPRLITAVKSLLSDDSAIWPLHCTAFYLGRIPDVIKLLGFEQPALHSSLAMEWHTHSICLAGHILGQVQCIAAITELVSDFILYPAHHSVFHNGTAVVASFPQ